MAEARKEVTTEIITWTPLARQKPVPVGDHKGVYLVKMSNGTIDFDVWSEKWKDFFKSSARDPKTGGRDYGSFAIAWAEMPKGYIAE
jgi:hypothetical protein